MVDIVLSFAHHKRKTAENQKNFSCTAYHQMTMKETLQDPFLACLLTMLLQLHYISGVRLSDHPLCAGHHSDRSGRLLFLRKVLRFAKHSNLSTLTCLEHFQQQVTNILALLDFQQRSSCWQLIKAALVPPPLPLPTTLV